MDGFQKKRYHLTDIGMDNDGLKDLMMIVQSLGRFCLQTVRTADVGG
ncbi:MAG: hypothetical protein WC836_10165 [Desulfobacula sp.]